MRCLSRGQLVLPSAHMQSLTESHVEPQHCPSAIHRLFLQSQEYFCGNTRGEGPEGCVRIRKCRLEVCSRLLAPLTSITRVTATVLGIGNFHEGPQHIRIRHQGSCSSSERLLL